MNMLKRSLAMMLALIMMISAVPFTAFATESTDVTSEPTEAVVDAPTSEPTVPETSVPETSVPETSVPETSVPETSVPETSVPETSVPETSVPETSVPQETVAEETVPEVTVAEEVPMILSLAKTTTQAVDPSDFIKVFHLDCGRKYFTVDQIKELIDKISSKGYSHMELAFGNNGLRFLLDDMSVGDYSDDAVTAAVQAGNAAYNATKSYSPSVNELTEADMDAIITHADSKGIEIIPLFNTPGHMNALVTAMNQLGMNANYGSSASTMDLTNDTAVSFTKELVLKYARYFDGKGCTYFNIGADEYANDSGVGFASLLNNGYGLFVSYVNYLVEELCDLGMTPIAFNDGIYYGAEHYTGVNYDEAYGTFDNRLVIAYWTGGYSGYYPVSVDFLTARDHKILYTRDNWYYVLGHATGTYGYDSALSGVRNISVNSGRSADIGAMQCLWCDDPHYDYETYKSNVMYLIDLLAANNPTYFTGPNEVTPDPDAPQKVTLTDDDTGVIITGYDLETLDVTANNPVSTDFKVTQTYEITLNGGNFDGGATVKIPYNNAFDNCKNFVGYVANEDGTRDSFEVKKEDGFFVCSNVPHFSEVTIEGTVYTVDKTVNVRIPVNGTSQTYTDNTGNYEESATIDDSTVARMNISGKTETGNASYDVIDTIESGARYLIAKGNSMITSSISENGYQGTWTDATGLLMTNETTNREANLWTITQVTGGYTVQNANGQYLSIADENNNVTLSNSPVTLNVIDNGNTFSFHNNGFYLNDFGDWNAFASSWQENNAGSKWTLQKYTPATVESTTVSFTGLKIGTTIAVVGSTQYNIEVLDPNNMFTKEENVELLVDEVKTITDNTGNYQASYTGAGGLDETIATVQVEGTSAAITPVTALTENDTFKIQISDGVYLKKDCSTTTSLDEAETWTVSAAYDTYQVITNSANQALAIDNNGNLYLYDYVDYNHYLLILSNGFIGRYNTSIVTTAKPVKVTGSSLTTATKITITGVSEGETKVIVGETRYNITVIGKTDITIKYKTADGTLIKEETVQVAKNATTYAVSNFTTEDGEFYAVNDPKVTNGTLAITPATTTEYTVTVTESEVDLSSVTPLTVEYWITNIQLTDPATHLNYLNISAETTGVYSESGVTLDSLLPDSLFVDRTREYWQVRMLDVLEENNSSSGTEHQTLGNGDDETTNGDAVTHVRYWNREWQVKSGSTWLTVDTSTVSAKYMSSGDNPTITYQDRTRNQLIAYYMEVIDIQNANGTTELHINAADWGKKGDGSPASDYLPYSSYCSVSIQLVYEDNNTNPSTTTAEALKSKTIVLGYWSDHRGIGTFNFDGLDQYQIYKVTAETGEITDISFSNGDWGTVTVNGFDWDSNEKTVWQKTPTQKVSIHNNAKYPDNTDPKDNLMWDENHEAILIRVYVKALATEDTLNVHYLDRTANNLQFYDYSIPVAENTVFNSGFAMGTETNTLVNNSVVNYYGSTQTVSADLATMPQIAAYYRYCNYTLVDAVRSDDGKDVYLYYTFTPVVTFAADFGLPIQITPTDLNQEGYSTNSADIKAVKVIGTYDNEAAATANAIYGSLSVSGTTVTYTPTTVMKGIDFFTIYVITQLDDASTNVTNEEAGIAYRVYVVPTTTVYYEESFLDYTGNWTKPAAPTIQQTTEVLGEHSYNYGYDPIYADDLTGSNNSKASTSTNGDTASFTFTGTGFELYANCEGGSGYVTVTSEGQTKKMYMVNTQQNYEAASDGTAPTFYNIPIVAEKGLTHGTYTVTVRNTHSDGGITIDGFRVINTLANSNVYAGDLEDNPKFYQLRDYVLHALNVDASTTVDQVYAAISADTEAPASAVITTTSTGAAAITDPQSLLDNGPKNEIYLHAGQTLTFNVETARAMQIGLKAPNGATTYDLSCTGVATKSGVEMNTSVDMFYELGNAINSDTPFTVTVKNTGDKILAVTDLKICDDPNAAFVALTEDDIAMILGVDDVEPEVPETPTEPETPVEPSKPTEPTEPEKPTEPEVEETKPSKPGKPGNNKPGKPSKPSKPGKDEEKADKVATLKVTYVSLFGRKIGTATLTKEGTGRCTFSAAEIRAAAPAGRMAIWMIPTMINYGTSASIVVPVI